MTSNASRTPAEDYAAALNFASINSMGARNRMDAVGTAYATGIIGYREMVTAYTIIATRLMADYASDPVTATDDIPALIL